MNAIKDKTITKDQRKLLEEYLTNLSRLNKSPHTIKNYRADLEKFFIWLNQNKSIEIHKVNSDTINDYKDFLQNGGAFYQTKLPNKSAQILFWFSTALLTAFFKKSHRTNSILFYQSPIGVNSRRRHLSSIKNFYEYLKQAYEDKSNKFQKNPIKSKIHTIILKDVDIEHTKIISSQDFQLIYEKSFRTKERLILDLLYYGGFRLSELCSLKILDFDFESRSITFIRKGGSRHKLYIENHQTIFQNLNYYLRERKDNSEFLFAGNGHQSISQKAMYNLIKKMIMRAQVSNEISPHSFRKACATNLYKKTKDLLFVRDYLNHSDAKVTQTYIDTKYLYKY